MRLVAAEEGIPAVLWAVLVFGGIAAIGFTYLFGLESTWAHRLMVVTLAAVIGLALFTIGALEHPFSGGARIGTGAFEVILTGEVRDQQAQRPPIRSVCSTSINVLNSRCPPLSSAATVTRLVSK